jgi:hypothetical protein
VHPPPPGWSVPPPQARGRVAPQAEEAEHPPPWCDVEAAASDTTRILPREWWRRAAPTPPWSPAPVPRHTLTLTLVQQLRLLLVLYRGLARGPWCLESRPKQQQDWILKWLQGGRAYRRTVCGVATLGCSPPALFHRHCWKPSSLVWGERGTHLYRSGGGCSHGACGRDSDRHCCGVSMRGCICTQLAGPPTSVTTTATTRCRGATCRHIQHGEVVRGPLPPRAHLPPPSTPPLSVANRTNRDSDGDELTPPFREDRPIPLIRL